MDIINNIKHFSPGLPRPYSSGNNGITSLLYTNIPYDEMSSPARRCWIEERFRVYLTLNNYDLLIFVGNIQNNGSRKPTFIIYQILGSSKRHFLYFFTFLMTQPWRCPSRVCCGYF